MISMLTTPNGPWLRPLHDNISILTDISSHEHTIDSFAKLGNFNLSSVGPNTSIDFTFEFEGALTIELAFVELPIILIVFPPTEDSRARFFSFVKIAYVFRMVAFINNFLDLLKPIDFLLRNDLSSRTLHISINPMSLPIMTTIDILPLTLNCVLMESASELAPIRECQSATSMFFAV